MTALIGQIVCEWSKAEHAMAMVLAAMLGENLTAGVALFTALRNARAQREAVQAVGASALSEQHNALLLAITAIYTSSGKLRNDIAHGIFGFSFDVEQAMIWVSSADYANYNASTYGKLAKLGESFVDHSELEKVMFVYKMKDFEEALSEIKYAHNLTFMFYGLARRRFFGGSEDYQKLCSEPRVVRELDRLRQGGKNNQDAQK